MGIEGAMPADEREKLRDELLAADHDFVRELPKVELHVHLEGVLTAELRWKLTQRNGAKLRISEKGPELRSLAEAEAAMASLRPDPSRMNNDEEKLQFFEAFYQGFKCLETEEDYFDLAWYYLEHVAKQNVRYCEIFWDPQVHTSLGRSWEIMMGGYRKARDKAKKELNVESAWIMCFLRDQSPEAAMECYKAALPYRDIIIGIGLDSNEEDRPPSLFEEVFSLARKDGFKLTMHCDIDQKNTPEHIRQAASVVAGKGLDRIDHGINTADQPDLMELVLKRDVALTLCPWSYLRMSTFSDLGPRIRKLYEAGIKISINSDDPAFMEDTWVLENFLLVQRLCSFSDKELVRLAKNAVEMSWAGSAIKQRVLNEIDMVYDKFH